MKVKELIKKLKEFDDDLEVVVDYFADGLVEVQEIGLGMTRDLLTEEGMSVRDVLNLPLEEVVVIN